LNPLLTAGRIRDVDVDINVTNDVGYEVAEKYQSVRSASGPVWINYTSYAEKRIRISGNIELVSANKPGRQCGSKDRRWLSFSSETTKMIFILSKHGYL